MGFASQWASALSVLRPGTCFTWAALTRKMVTLPSRRLYTGRQYSPVLSIATWVIPASANQSDKASKSGVIVPNSRSSMRPSACWPAGSGVTRHAITVFLCTSNPAQWGKITSMHHLRQLGGLAGYPDIVILSCVLRFPREAGDNPWSLGVSGVQLYCRLAAPTYQRPHGQPMWPQSIPQWARGGTHTH